MVRHFLGRVTGWTDTVRALDWQRRWKRFAPCCQWFPCVIISEASHLTGVNIHVQYTQDIQLSRTKAFLDRFNAFTGSENVICFSSHVYWRYHNDHKWTGWAGLGSVSQGRDRLTDLPQLLRKKRRLGMRDAPVQAYVRTALEITSDLGNGRKPVFCIWRGSTWTATSLRLSWQP